MSLIRYLAMTLFGIDIDIKRSVKLPIDLWACCQCGRCRERRRQQKRPN